MALKPRKATMSRESAELAPGRIVRNDDSTTRTRTRTKSYSIDVDLLEKIERRRREEPGIPSASRIVNDALRAYLG